MYPAKALDEPVIPLFNPTLLEEHSTVLALMYSSSPSPIKETNTVVFVDNLTKWVEAFTVSDEQSETIARLLVEGVICRHGVPECLLSDRGSNFLSDLMMEVCRLMDMKKVNTSGYHPQSDGLVKRFHSRLTNMLSKCVDCHGKDWDLHLPYVLYAYRVTAQESTKESPFFLLYGRDP